MGHFGHVNVVVTRAYYTEFDTGIFELVIETRETGYALIHRARGAEPAAAVKFTNGDELRAILPSLPTTNFSYDEARARLVEEWETEAKRPHYEEPLHMRMEVEGDPLFAPPGAPIAGYRIRDVSDLTPEEPRWFSWPSFTIYPTYEHAVVGQHRAGLSPGRAAAGTR